MRMRLSALSDMLKYISAAGDGRPREYARGSALLLPGFLYG